MYQVVQAPDGWDVLDHDGKAAEVALPSSEVPAALEDEGLGFDDLVAVLWEDGSESLSPVNAVEMVLAL